MTASVPPSKSTAATTVDDARETVGPTTDPTTDPTTESVPEERLDGRTARARRTRTTIVDAMLELLEEGDLQPTAGRIAERAGISLRLIYHHFGDLESLFRAAARREAERLMALSAEIDMTMSLEDRLDELLRQRTKQLELITPVRRASLLQEPFSEEVRIARDTFSSIAEQVALAAFEPELEDLPPARRKVVSDAVGTTLMWGFWNDLRTSGRSVEDSTAALRAIVVGLFNP